MNIAVSTRFLLADNLEGYGYFIKEVFKILAEKNPQHQFYFIFDRSYSNEFVFSDNVHPVIVQPAARHPLLWKYWYDIKIPIALRNVKADVFVSPDGFSSLTTKVPQCIVMHDLGFIHHASAYKKSHVLFYKKYTPLFLKKSGCIATVSEFSKQDLVSHYKIDPNRISVVYNAARQIFRPVSKEQQTSCKEIYTGGKEFFIYIGAIHPRKNLVNLLKAFSIFKKRQKTGMKLVLVGRLAWKNEHFLKLLQSYKYREDIVLTGYLDDNQLATLLGSAYAMVYPSVFEGFGVPVLEAMKSDVPVLTSEKTSMQEIAENAALYFDPLNYEDIAEKLMLIYKDEDLRKKLIEKGKIISSKYSWEYTADLLWQCIEKAASY